MESRACLSGFRDTATVSGPLQRGEAYEAGDKKGYLNGTHYPRALITWA
jgi:hypothetical protein